MDVEPDIITHQCETIRNAVQFLDEGFSFSDSLQNILNSIVIASYKIEEHMYKFDRRSLDEKS